MKNFRLVVALRLAIFPLIFNLSFAQELEVITNELLFWMSDNEVKDSENETPMDSSSQAHQNDNNIVPLYESGYSEAEGIFSDEEEILSPSDSSPSKEQNSESEVFSPDRGSGEAEGVDDDIPMNFPLSSEWQEKFDLPNLIISEVYRLWTTERIEITNISDEDFSWKLSLSW